MVRPKRCPRCYKDVSATWIECAIRCGLLTTEEKFFVWDTLRADRALRRYRKQRQMTMTKAIS